MTFTPGDRVHLAGLGTGIIREARGGRRYAVEIKGRMVVAAAADLEPADPPTKPTSKRANAPVAPAAPAAPRRTRAHPAAPAAPAAPGHTRAHPAAPSRTQPHLATPDIDLHGMTVDDAIAAVEMFVNDALLAGLAEARVMHGRGAGRLKAAVHQYLRGLGVVASFRIDPRNPGVTIIAFE